MRSSLLSILFMVAGCVSINVPLSGGSPAEPKIKSAPSAPFVAIDRKDNSPGLQWQNPGTHALISTFETCERPPLEMKEFMKGFQRKMRHDRVVLTDDYQSIVEGESDEENLRLTVQARRSESCKIFLVLSQKADGISLPDAQTDQAIFDRFVGSFSR